MTTAMDSNLRSEYAPDGWQSNPTSADLVRETRLGGAKIFGLPHGMELEVAADILVQLNIPLQPIPDTESYRYGWLERQVETREGNVICRIEGNNIEEIEREKSLLSVTFTEAGRELLLRSHATPNDKTEIR